ncbi:unnamed protein product [Staurois parvus]|uniref:GIY-YIG domain-containing protein n=1 Tax=Staurois parvus TaxID=386267 RepID=A0ABN9DPQ2_9NEOB|nr:unnamed protein product [Staurois parvus]
MENFGSINCVKIHQLCNPSPQYETIHTDLKPYKITPRPDLYRRFREQGYSHSQIRKARRRAYQTDRKDLLSPKKEEKVKLSEQPVRMITQFGAQWQAVKQILEKHWKILTQCPKLNKIVGERPQMVARRAPNLGDLLIHSDYQPLKQTTWLKSRTKGMFKCGKCQICKYVDRTDSFFDSRNSTHYKIQSLINCSTVRVLYILTCPCKKMYIGKTKRQLKVRIGEHFRDIRSNDPESNLAQHYAKYHGGKLDGTKVKGFYALHFPQRRGDFDRELLKKEKYWIYKLDTLYPKGLNVECDLQVFLDK